jgi:plastocyanin
VTSHIRLLTMSAIAVTMAAALACGGGGGPTNPSPNPGGGGGSPGPSGATITINANGVATPSSVTINSGESVTFVNNHTLAHEMSSDPHPAHTDCPSMQPVGILTQGQSRLTNAFTTARTCGFHDHRDDTNPSLRGTIVIR